MLARPPSLDVTPDPPTREDDGAAPQPDDGVDVTLIRWMLSLSPEERLDVLQSFIDDIAELTDAETAS